MSSSFEKVAVLGTGLIGGSLAGALRERKMAATIVGMGRGQANLDRARERGLIDSGTTVLEIAIAGADLIVLAAPADGCVDLLDELAKLGPKIRPDAVVTDAASVKRPLVAAAQGGGFGARFVGAHPMAGGTHGGAVAADVRLFVNRAVVVTPELAEPSAVARVRAMWEGVGARVIEMSAARHDRVVARVSHLPQAIAWALAAMLDRDHERDVLIEVAANGLRDMTRLAESDLDMWRPIFAANRDELSAAIGLFGDELAALREAIDAGDEAALVERVDRARTLRALLQPR